MLPRVRRRSASTGWLPTGAAYVGGIATFSSIFGVTRATADDWFDPDLAVDTKLFVDPFLLLDEEGTGSSWDGAHRDLIAHFTKCYELLAKGAKDGLMSTEVARALLTFPEPAELCLGYTTAGTSGSGSGRANARLIIGSIVTAIAAGLDRPEHIEEIGILNEGIGADRISDAVCNVLKPRLIAYTKEVAVRHGVACERIRVRNARCNLATGRWITEEHDLPKNPHTGRAVLLVPSRFLNSLPVLNADDWFESSFNADLRRELNVQVGARVPKKTIVRLARRHPDRIREWANELRARGQVKGYDFASDPLGVVKWQAAGAAFAQANPLDAVTSVTTAAELKTFVAHVVELYRQFIEEQAGWKLLWNDDGTEKPEEAAQLAFLGVARNYCRTFGVELDREVNFGRGPVDFKLNTGASARLLIEAKKLHNGDFWNGLELQLPSYQKSDGTNAGWLLAIQYRSGGVSKTRPMELRRRVDGLNKKLGVDVSFTVVDARPKASASNIRRGRP